MSFAFIIAAIKKNNSIVDIFWGLGFVLIAWFTLFKTNLFLPRQLLVTALVSMWGIRLSAYLFKRNWSKPEDPRYTQLAKKWGNYFYIKSFFNVFMLQGLLLLFIASSIIVINISSINGLTLLDWFAALSWCVGFIIQIIADAQLQNFLANKKNKGKILQSGLWKYSRHPNYFGEIIMWWSIWLIALSVPFGWYAIMSPLTITSIFLFISIPLTEKLFDRNQQYEKYKKETSILIPWFK